MSYSKISKTKRIFILSLLILTTVFTTININYFSLLQNHIITDSETNEDYDSDYDNENFPLMADYSSSFGRSGEDIDISLHQSLVNTTQGDFANLDTANTLKEACPTDTSFNSSYTNIVVDNINAPNKSIIVEDTLIGAGFEQFFLGEYYVSFTTRGSGYLENISIPIKLVAAGVDANITIKLYNAQNDGAGTPEPNANQGLIVPKTLITSNTYYWHDFKNVHAFFNSSETYANTFFLRVEKVQGGTVYWDWYSDGADADESLVYTGALILETSGVNTIDLGLKVAFSPEDHTPKPESINFLINGTAVIDDTVIENKGSWTSYNVYRNSSGLLYFKLTAEWWDVSCRVTYAQINYTKTDLIAASSFTITGSGQSLDWNCTLGGVNSFVSPFKNFEINFTVPRIWENFSAFKGPTDKTTDISQGPTNNGYLDLRIRNAENGLNWYITAQSKNLLKRVHTLVSLSDLSTVDYTDIISFVANFSEIISNGEINLTVYSPAPGYYENHSHYDNTITAGSELSLGTWDISTTASEYGVFRVHIWWHNDTAGGFLEKDITIMAVTDLVLISPPLSQNRFPDDIFNIRVFYNDTGLDSGDQGITGASANFIVNTTIIPPIVDEGTGYYQIQINSSDYNFRMNYIGISTSKTYYNSDSTEFSFHLRQYTTISPTDSKDFGAVIRGTILQYEFNYSDILGTPIAGATTEIVQFISGSSINENVGEPGNYTIQLDTSSVQASAVPYECIFNITANGKETQNITVYVTVTLSQTDVDIINFEPYLIKREGLNQTVLFYFNDTDNNIPITGLPVDDVSVIDNQTLSPRKIWLTPNGTNGYYTLNISINALNSGWIRLRINVTFEPNYATSLELVDFYYQGNLTQTNIKTVSDPGGEGILTGIANTYTCFVGRDLFIDFNITDNYNADKIITGTANNYLVEYIEVGNPINQGSLGNSLDNATNSYQGTIDTSDITVLGTYEISVKTRLTNFETSILSFNLTLRALYAINISIVDKPTQITAGDSFHIIVQVEYHNTTEWLIASGSNVRITPIFDGTPGTTTSWSLTNGTGEVDFQVLTSNTIRNITLIIEVQVRWFHETGTKNVYNIVVHPPSGFNFEDFLPYLILIGLAAVAVAISVGIYKGIVVPKKREKTRVLTEVKTIFDDAINLEHILVLYKATGTCIYFKSFGSDQIDPELISGFISAISSFGKDLVSQEELNEISYGDKMLLLSDGEHIRVALVLGKKASLILRRNLMEFIHKFEKEYSNDLPNWRGQLNIFRAAGAIVDDVLSTSIILPHEISYEHSTAKALKKPQSQGVLKIAKNLMKDSQRNFFFIATLLKEATEKSGKDTAEIFIGIKELRDKKILLPIEISAIETKPISQQELNLINQKVSQLVNLTPEDKQKLVNDLAQMGPAEREAYFVSLTEHHAIVSAPIETKPGAAVVENIKGAKKEIKNLKKNGLIARKEKDYDKSIKIFQNALKIASNWELVKESQEFDDLIRLTKIEDLKSKMKALEKEARLAAKEENYNEAAQKYKMSSKIASEIFKLGEDLTKEVKRLSNKAKEYEKLL
jgi:hypothetical protein